MSASALVGLGLQILVAEDGTDIESEGGFEMVAPRQREVPDVQGDGDGCGKLLGLEGEAASAFFR